MREVKDKACVIIGALPLKKAGLAALATLFAPVSSFATPQKCSKNIMQKGLCKAATVFFNGTTPPEGVFIITADAGYKTAEMLGLVPDIAAGDWDTAPAPEAAQECITLPKEKDDTDTHYAARIALEMGFTRVLLTGVLGGRLDHTLASFATMLYLAENGVDTIAIGEEEIARIATPQKSVVLEENGQSYFSVFPLQGTANGVSISGAKYPLAGATLTASMPLGVSNSFCPRTKVEISTVCGPLLVLEVYE